MAIFVLEKVGLADFGVVLEDVYGRFLRKKPKKSGQKPGFENQKWAEKIGGIF